jgi:transposase-like protein
VTGSEIITRRRKWKPAERAVLLAEVEAAGGKVVVVARRHGISESLLYNWGRRGRRQRLRCVRRHR